MSFSKLLFILGANSLFELPIAGNSRSLKSARIQFDVSVSKEERFCQESRAEL